MRIIDTQSANMLVHISEECKSNKGLFELGFKIDSFCIFYRQSTEVNSKIVSISTTSC